MAENDYASDVLAIDDGRGVERILVVTAHPDDVDFGVAGSVATWVKAGIDVRLLHRHRRRRRWIGPVRSRVPTWRCCASEEQRAAAAEVGVTDVTFLGFPDGRLVPSIELRRDISRQIRRVQPGARRVPVARAALGSHRCQPSRSPRRW